MKVIDLYVSLAIEDIDSTTEETMQKIENAINDVQEVVMTMGLEYKEV